MSRLSELIRDLCPDGVEFKALEEIFVTRNGYTPRKGDASAWESGDVPWFRMEDIRENGGILSNARTRVSSSAVKGGRVFPANSILVATSATIGAHALITVPHLSNQRFTSLQLKEEYCGVFDHKFLYYYCFLLDEHCLKNVHVSSFASVGMRAFRSFRFPVVPLEVQQEIVRILDQFTTLEAELEAELEARRKQYEYYRDSLLSFHPGDRSVRWVSIGDASDVFGGLTGKRKGDFGVGDARYASYRNVYSNIALDVDPEERVRIRPDENQRRLLLGDLVLTGSSESRDEVGMSSVVVDQPPHDLYLNSFCIGVRWRNPEAYYPNFVKHLFRSGAMRKLISCSADGVTRFNLSKRKLKKLVIPVPLIEEQRRIADILDRFDTLVNDISSGLPAEIAARHEQYEYYRNMVLTFPERRR